MFKTYFVLLLLAHIIGDFYVPTDRLVNKKTSRLKWVICHCLCYAVIIVMITISVLSTMTIMCGITVVITHLIAEIIKYFYTVALKKKEKMTIEKERKLFFTIQAVQLICLFIASYFFARQGERLTVCSRVSTFFETIEINKIDALCWVTSMLIIHRPTNMIISKFLLPYRPEEKNNEKQNSNTGKFVGTIERIIILLFIWIEQYAAIGLVLTAKSIARYDKISEEEDFAEYYLLGTLLSTATVVLVSLII